MRRQLGGLQRLPGCVASAGGYPSGHATLTNAAREVIEGVFGWDAISITVSIRSFQGVILQYSRLQEITLISTTRVSMAGYTSASSRMGASSRDAGSANTYKNSPRNTKGRRCENNHYRYTSFAIPADGPAE